MVLKYKYKYPGGSQVQVQVHVLAWVLKYKYKYFWKYLSTSTSTLQFHSPGGDTVVYVYSIGGCICLFNRWLQPLLTHILCVMCVSHWKNYQHLACLGIDLACINPMLCICLYHPIWVGELVKICERMKVKESQWNNYQHLGIDLACINPMLCICLYHPIWVGELVKICWSKFTGILFL